MRLIKGERAEYYKELVQKKYWFNISIEEAENELARFLDLLDFIINDTNLENYPRHNNGGVKN